MLETSLAFKNDARYCVFDTESNGLNLLFSQPFQLSWVIADNRGVIETHDRFIKWPDFKMSEEAARVTKFNMQAYLAKAEEPSAVFADFKKVLFDPKTIICAHNGFNFDIFMLRILMKACGETNYWGYLPRLIDTKVLSIAYQKNIKYDGSTPFLVWQYKVNSIIEKGLKSSQQFMLDLFEIPYEKDRLHEALYDITKLYEILKKIILAVDVPDIRGV